MVHLHEDKIKFLEETAAKIRYDTIEMVINAGSGHVAGPLDMADIFTAMYFHILKHEENLARGFRAILIAKRFPGLKQLLGLLAPGFRKPLAWLSALKWTAS